MAIGGAVGPDHLESRASRLTRSAVLGPSGGTRVAGLGRAAAAALEERDLPSARSLLAALESSTAATATEQVTVLGARIMLADGALVEGARLLQEAAESLPPSRWREAARLLVEASRALVDADLVADALTLITQARGRLTGGDPVLSLLVESTYAEALAVGGQFMPAVLAYRKAAERADRKRTVHADPNASICLAEALHSAGLNDRARQLTRTLADAARARGDLAGLRYLLSIRFSIESVDGRVAAARRAATEELWIAADGGLKRERKESLGHLAWCAAYAGQQDECRRLVQERLELMRRSGSGRAAHQSLGVLELGLGNAEAAVPLLSAILDEQTATGWRTAGTFSPVAPELIEALARSGRVAEATGLLDRFEADATDLARPHSISLAHRCRGLLPDCLDVDAEFGSALLADLGEPRPLERARTLLTWGERLRRQRRRAEAITRLGEALDLFTELGADLWRRRTLVEMSACGRRVGTHGPFDPLELTPQERRVSSLVSTGLSNKAVADRMFVSVNTVETHLRHAFVKLDVRSRTELARKFTDLRDSTLPADP
ncbi:MAG TPA: LuxR C-terminal-related transcriptional regulator [Pedococcus sp.]|nr:LuxR C-terminal-related transcriptional regulator [Pedococcus sp.]